MCEIVTAESDLISHSREIAHRAISEIIHNDDLSAALDQFLC
jgi:hypothetical protein